jgi:hypothetical protein
MMSCFCAQYCATSQEKHAVCVIRNGIAHLKDAQQKNGSFASLSSFAQDDFGDAIEYSTTFFTATILSCLVSLQKNSAISPEIPTEANNVRKRGVDFLKKEMNPSGSWNYWGHESKGRTAAPYPDDLDDTFAALAALRQYDANLIDGKVFASVAKMLTALEIQEGGPYKTWLIDSNAGQEWQDIDLAVNSTIVYFLSFVGVHLPNLERFMDEAIEADRLESPYYPGLCQVAYFVSRAYRGKFKEKLAELILGKLEGHPGTLTPLERAMAISTLTNLGLAEKIPSGKIDDLLKCAEEEGWRPYAFCIDPSRGGKKSYAGASALTAAFCVEAFAKYLEATDARAPKTQENPHASSRTIFRERIKTIAKHECETAGGNIRKIALEKIDATTDERIILLARDFKIAISERGSTISAETIERLSLANLYGWLAYTIYDDLLDGEGNSLFLPAANLFSRKLAGQYAALDKKIPGAMDLFRSTMDEIDEANAWEQIHCRAPKDILPESAPSFENYENLASRSIGHALGPLVELLSLGYARDSKELLAVESFFRHYLIARQLHDDAHDWADDLLRGQINSVAALALKRYGRVPPSISIIENLPGLEHLFWTDIINDIAETIIFHVTVARCEREQSGIIDPSFMESALLSLKHDAQKAIEERDEALRFLTEYKSSTRPPTNEKC